MSTRWRNDHGVPRCLECPLRAHDLFRPTSPHVMAFVERSRTGFRALPARAQILIEGGHSRELYTLFSGWAFCHKLLDDGRRQILRFFLPGDFIGLQEDVDGVLEYTVETVTPVRLCIFSKEQVITHARIEADVSWEMTSITLNEEETMHEHLTDLGRRSAEERLGHLLLEIFDNMRLRGDATRDRCELPLTQAHLADALGLSTAHVNRVLRHFREAGLATIANSTLKIYDFQRLSRLSGYQSSYIKPRPLF